MLISEKMAYSRYEFFPIHQKMRNWYLGNYKKKKKKRKREGEKSLRVLTCD